MRYEMISADCHIDLCWLPPDLFTTNASAGLRDRMPYVTDGPKGPRWVTKTDPMPFTSPSMAPVFVTQRGPFGPSVT